MSPKPQPIGPRLWPRVVVTPGCWLWTGAQTSDGYGRFTLNNRTVGVHRLTYELLVGPIPEGMQLDHLCRVPQCCNPAHLEPVTPRLNTHRSPIAPAALNARKSHCPYGHPYDGPNLILKSGHRVCRECKRRQGRESEARRRARAKKRAA